MLSRRHGAVAGLAAVVASAAVLAGPGDPAEAVRPPATVGPVTGELTAGPVTGELTAGPVTGELTAGPVTGELTSGPVTGELTAGVWTKVLWGWGFYNVDYYASISATGGRYACYPGRAGDLPSRITHTVSFYGDCWLYSPANATYALWPVGP